MLQHIPTMDLPDAGDWRQGIGVELPVVVINLAHRTDRWQTIAARMSAVGLDKLIKAPAVAGAAIGAPQMRALLGDGAELVDEAPTSHLTLTRPAVGCFLSHLAIWRWVVTANVDRVLVFEDDANPAPGFDAGRFLGAVASLGPETGLLLPGSLIMGGLAERPAAGATRARLYYFNGTFAYFVTHAAARWLLEHVPPPRFHIDHQISHALVANRRAFSAAYCVPHLFEPDWSQRSDCYVPLGDEGGADGELGRLIEANRKLLLDEGRPLLNLDNS